MIATGKPGMSESEVKEFVNYFWRSLHPELFITPLTQNPELTDLVVEISPDPLIREEFLVLCTGHVRKAETLLLHNIIQTCYNFLYK